MKFFIFLVLSLFMVPTVAVAQNNIFTVDGIAEAKSLTFNPYPDLIIHSGKTIVVIKADGTVTHEGTLEESAQAFWDQVQKMGFKFKCEKKD